MEEIKKTFSKVVAIIENAKKNAYRKVNEELINMYWCVGQFISEEAKAASYGDSFIRSSRYLILSTSWRTHPRLEYMVFLQGI